MWRTAKSFTPPRMSLDRAKYAAVEFAAAHSFGVQHDLVPEIIAATLGWDVVP